METKIKESIENSLQSMQEYKESILEALKIISEQSVKEELFAAEVTRSVCEELTSSGKPAFSNETARNAEISIRSLTDEGYLELRKSLAHAKATIKGAEVGMMIQQHYINYYMTLLNREMAAELKAL